MKRVLVGAPVALAVILVSGEALATPVTFYFGGVITSVNDDGGTARGGDPSLLGSGSAALGTRFSGQYTFDNAWSPIPGICSIPCGEDHYASEPDSTAYTARGPWGEGARKSKIHPGAIPGNLV